MVFIDQLVLMNFEKVEDDFIRCIRSKDPNYLRSIDRLAVSPVRILAYKEIRPQIGYDQ